MTEKRISKKTLAVIREYPDEAYEIEMMGVEQGQTHKKPSEETINLIKRMEENFNTHLEYIKEALNRHEKKIDSFIKCSEDKFAPKWVETAIKWTIGSVMFAVLAAILKVVIIG